MKLIRNKHIASGILSLDRIAYSMKGNTMNFIRAQSCFSVSFLSECWRPHHALNAGRHSPKSQGDKFICFLHFLGIPFLLFQQKVVLWQSLLFLPRHGSPLIYSLVMPANIRRPFIRSPSF